MVSRVANLTGCRFLRRRGRSFESSSDEEENDEEEEEDEDEEEEMVDAYGSKCGQEINN